MHHVEYSFPPDAGPKPAIWTKEQEEFVKQFPHIARIVNG